MINNRNGKKTLWIYAVVLFISAFIVLLISSYSQIKFNNNLKDSTERSKKYQKEKDQVQMSLAAVLKENEKLDNQLKETSKKLKEVEEEYGLLKEEKETLKGMGSPAYIDYENLTRAYYLARDKKYIEVSELLIHNITATMLDKYGVIIYNELKSDFVKKGALELYFKGIDAYYDKEYGKSKNLLERSYYLDSYGDLADNCIYYIAMSEYNTGNIENAHIYFEHLITSFKESSYVNKSKLTMKSIEDALYDR